MKVLNSKEMASIQGGTPCEVAIGIGLGFILIGNPWVLVAAIVLACPSTAN